MFALFYFSKIMMHSHIECYSFAHTAWLPVDNSEDNPNWIKKFLLSRLTRNSIITPGFVSPEIWSL